jgi:hypothetical protein
LPSCAAYTPIWINPWLKHTRGATSLWATDFTRPSKGCATRFLLALNLQHDAEEEAAATTLPAQLESTAKRKGNAKADEVQPVSDLFDSRRERA